MNLWEDETAFYITQLGTDPEKARIMTILRWMWHGDFRPLAAAIDKDQFLDPAIINLLSRMIHEGRLQLRHRKGRPKKPEAGARQIAGAVKYENLRLSGRASDEAFREIARAFGTSEQSIRQAVTAWRKAERKRNNN